MSAAAVTTQRYPKTTPLITKHTMSDKWWRITQDCGKTEPVGPFETREEAERAESYG